MDDHKLTGGCLCGAVRYTVDGPVKYTSHCHCSMCQRCHGAVFGTYSSIRSDRLTIDRGRENIQVYRSSPPVRRSFCGTCGCPLFFESAAEPGYIAFTAATLDGGVHPGHPPEMERHIFVESKLPWYAITDGVPQVEGDYIP